jgi:hypothetical protein
MLAHYRPTGESGPIAVVASSRHSVADTFSDGIPDYAHLEGADADSFRHWFTFLAESQYFADAAQPDVTDCAALLRFAFRESLRKHDGAWAAEMHLARLPGSADIRKPSYPYSPLHAAIFRVRPGSYSDADATNGTFAEFADADTLRRLNTYFVSRSIDQARDGDLLFYRQPDQRSPYHAMIFLERSRFDGTAEPLVVYHTGAIAGTAGEVRRPTLRELLRHPEPRWRPLPENPTFLGVYRWKILRSAP